MRSLIFFLIIFITVSCSNSDQTKERFVYEDAVHAFDDTARIREMLHPDTISERLLLVARGSEPGWYAEFYDERIFLVSDYGKDTLNYKGISFENIASSDAFVTNYDQEVKANGRFPGFSIHLKVEVKPGNCTEAGSGEARSHIVLVFLNGKSFKGCGYRP